jgi:hypothetical protein
MFQFPEFAPDGLYIQPSVAVSGCPAPRGCPIRKSPDQSAFDRSPELIAVYNVLLRLCTPRHPPCTLNSLTTFMKHCDQTVLYTASTLHLSKIAGRRRRSTPRLVFASLRRDLLAYHKFSACQVEPTGIEPATSALQTRRSPN